MTATTKTMMTNKQPPPSFDPSLSCYSTFTATSLVCSWLVYFLTAVFLTHSSLASVFTILLYLHLLRLLACVKFSGLVFILILLYMSNIQHSFIEMPSSLALPGTTPSWFPPIHGGSFPVSSTTDLEMQACFSSSSALSVGNLSPFCDLNYCLSLHGTPQLIVSALISLLSSRHLYTTAF